MNRTRVPRSLSVLYSHELSFFKGFKRAAHSEVIDNEPVEIQNFVVARYSMCLKSGFGETSGNKLLSCSFLQNL